MAVTASGFYGLTLIKFLNSSTLVTGSLDSETLVKVLMVTDTEAPNFDTHDFRNDILAEVTGTAYTLGGVAVTSTALSVSAGTLSYDSVDPSWAASTIANAMAAVCYLNVGTAATDPLVFLSDFVTAASSSAGTFTVQVPAAGWFQLDYTP